MSAHGYVAYTHGCRCDECRAAKAAYMRQKRRAARDYAGQLIAVDGSRYVAPGITHGTYAGYQDARCRCLECTAAKAAVDRQRRTGRAS